jgi:hypothetical protein
MSDEIQPEKPEPCPICGCGHEVSPVAATGTQKPMGTVNMTEAPLPGAALASLLRKSCPDDKALETLIKIPESYVRKKCGVQESLPPNKKKTFTVALVVTAVLCLLMLFGKQLKPATLTVEQRLQLLETNELVVKENLIAAAQRLRQQDYVESVLITNVMSQRADISNIVVYLKQPKGK